MDKHSTGLTVPQALERLHNDLKEVLDEKDWNGTSGWAWMWASVMKKQAPLTLPSVIVVIIASGMLMVSSFIDDTGATPSPMVGLVILVFLTASLASVVWEDKLRKEETLGKATRLVESIKQLQGNVVWGEDDYPILSSPPSPCITLQWTYRNGHVVNLPWALLVRGDIILLRPGQVVPGHCISVEDKSEPEFMGQEIHLPEANKEGSLPAMRHPLENKKFELQETPYASNLRLSLQRALNRPTSFHEKERHLLVTICTERVALLFFVISVLSINIVRYVQLRDWFPNTSWWQLLVLEPVTVILPLFPLTLPVMWRLYNVWGVTNIRTVLQAAIPVQIGQDPFEKPLEVETNALEFHLQWKLIVEEFLGKSTIPLRATNLLHALGSVTALSCVDKKGILSWPNPTAEKVLFLRPSTPEEQKQQREQNLKLRKAEEVQEWETEVLDVTHGKEMACKLNFDKHDWKEHLNSLKPLGLAILVNTCHPSTQEMYSQFCCHLSCEAAQDDSLVPVTTRRCLCELAALIGFEKHVPDGFSLEQMLCTYQQVESERVKRGIKFARQLTNTKVPLPHMVSTTIRDKHTNILHMLTQGTADVILESCVEYWDGHDILPLTPVIRKRILEFYQRSSLSTHCSAFSYRPLSKKLSPAMANYFLEVPSDSRQLYLPFRSPTPQALSSFDGKWKGTFGQFLSNDSLLGMDGKEEIVTDVDGWLELQSNQIFIGMVTMQYQAQPDVVHLIEQLENACIRFVHFSKENELRSRTFSEKIGLESGWNCHVSLLADNQNRSEAEGASAEEVEEEPPPDSAPDESEAAPLIRHKEFESHNERTTSLLNSRGLSASAPGAINTDLNVVKFDDAALNWDEDGSAPSGINSRSRDRRDSQESDMRFEEQWRSLSCLTDSSDQSVPFNFEISNRAKLPRGIDEIRPHIEEIDNVPLLVPLFTDCNPVVTRQMIEIMQEYGEVVVVVGSSANADNVEVFLQSDSSIAMEPLYPQVCHKQTPTPSRSQGPSPVEVSAALNSLPCALSMRRQDSLSMSRLIACARHFCQSLRNCVQFWLCCVFSVSTLMLVCAILMLPPPLNAGQILVLCCIVVPILATSLMSMPMDPEIMHTATGKNLCTVNMKDVSFVWWCYGLKFLPGVCTIALTYATGLAFYCHDIASVSNSTVSLFYPMAVADGPWLGWNSYHWSILLLQHWCSFLFILHWSSVSFLDRSRQLWHYCGEVFLERKWMAACLLVFAIQVFYTGLVLLFTTSSDLSNELQPTSLPWCVIVGGSASPLLVLIVNEIVKWQEIKVNTRFQRRIRLDFGTKLGMNSPF